MATPSKEVRNIKKQFGRMRDANTLPSVLSACEAIEGVNLSTEDVAFLDRLVEEHVGPACNGPNALVAGRVLEKLEDITGQAKKNSQGAGDAERSQFTTGDDISRITTASSPPATTTASGPDNRGARAAKPPGDQTELMKHFAAIQEAHAKSKEKARKEEFARWAERADRGKIPGVRDADHLATLTDVSEEVIAAQAEKAWKKKRAEEQGDEKEL